MIQARVARRRRPDSAGQLRAARQTVSFASGRPASAAVVARNPRRARSLKPAEASLRAGRVNSSLERSSCAPQRLAARQVERQLQLAAAVKFGRAARSSCCVHFLDGKLCVFRSSFGAGMAGLGSRISRTACVLWDKASTSRMFPTPVTYITRRSKPRPKPACLVAAEPAQVEIPARSPLLSDRSSSIAGEQHVEALLALRAAASARRRRARADPPPRDGLAVLVLTRM